MKKIKVLVFHSKAYNWRSGDPIEASIIVTVRQYRKMVKNRIIPDGGIKDVCYHISWLEAVKEYLYDSTVDKNIKNLLLEE